MDKSKKIKVDFTKIRVISVDDTSEVLDLSKIVGNCVYRTTPDIGMADLARTVYHDGVADMTSAEINYFQQIIYSSSYVLAAFKKPISQLLIDILNLQENESNQI